MASGAWTAAWPLIRTDLGLSYAQIGVLLSLPSIFGSALEPPFALMGDAWRRTLLRGGGVAFCISLALIAASGGILPLLFAAILASPASGVFVGLSQASLMDMDPARHEQNMARWVVAGSLGALAGPLALAAVGWLELGWRSVFAIFAVGMVPLLVVVWRTSGPAPAQNGQRITQALAAGAREALHALRNRAVVRWLTLLQLADLALDVLFGFLALYFVDVAGASGAGAVVAITVWTGVGLLGDALAVPLLERVEGTRYLRFSAAAMLVVLPAFLLVDARGAKLALLAAIALLNSGWYSVLQGRLYSELPGRSTTVIALASLFGTVGGVIPLLIGLFAERFGLGAAMWLTLAGPLALVVGLPRGAGKPADPSEEGAAVTTD